MSANREANLVPKRVGVARFKLASHVETGQVILPRSVNIAVTIDDKVGVVFDRHRPSISVLKELIATAASEMDNYRFFGLHCFDYSTNQYFHSRMRLRL